MRRWTDSIHETFFDVNLLYENEGMTDALSRTFLIYVASSGRPPQELVRPLLADLDEAFVKEFEGDDDRARRPRRFECSEDPG